MKIMMIKCIHSLNKNRVRVDDIIKTRFTYLKKQAKSYKRPINVFTNFS